MILGSVITAEEIQAESSIPSHQRLTVNGGYAATASHRKKIALANAGKQPWNKGKRRSEADKANQIVYVYEALKGAALK